MSLLYEGEAKDLGAHEVLAALQVMPDPFVIDLVEGVEKHHERIDELIGQFAIDWSLDRMPVIDRTLLRLAVYELLERDDVPTGAIISEAVELAKRFSTDESGRFVNGVLGSVAAAVRTSSSS